jgi:L-threonylcarbamoyladenylate synthase
VVIKAALRRRIRAHVAGGGLVAYATASCFGLGCDPRNPRAIARLLRLKRRRKHKGFILIADRFSRLAPFVQVPDNDARRRLEFVWPGPHTWLIAASPKTSRWVRGANAKVAVRVDAHPDARTVCAIVGGALVSTSLNRAGLRSIRTCREARRQFGANVLVVPGKIGNARTPSTIQDFDTGHTVRS